MKMIRLIKETFKIICWLYTKKCKKLKNESTENRHNLVKHKIFFASIVFSTHMINTCKSKRHCPEDDCQKRHHTLLHSKEMPVPDSSDQVDSNIINIIEKEILSQTYLQIVPVTLTNNGRNIKVHTNALLDTDLDTTLRYYRQTKVNQNKKGNEYFKCC